MLLIKEQEIQLVCPCLVDPISSSILIAVFLCLLSSMHRAGGRVGDAAVGCDLPLSGSKDGGDPRTVTPGPTGNYTTLLPQPP
jgi:hypothetical protein